ncbi:uncharacterized protein LOC110459861 [Mizuhopecten yessoensis]|uniref:Uncharacterized protein n=1 Tax=Mizuhopecten yessoensis TaxID=6573 RepID=A0A210Q3M4_MIZYE|nr:uncharacterized protein LOC110459861 [Mizuhopecten yessoensis]OWF43344.1 hypothetical protein KP79_PYT12658 [Mizuhopecten yessoensis]
MERSQECDDFLNLDNEAKVSSLILLVLITIHLGLSEHAIIPHHPSTPTCSMSSHMTCDYDFQAEYFYTLTKACQNCTNNVTDCYRPGYISAGGNMYPKRFCG